MATASQARSPAIRSLIPARIDRLGWSKFRTRMVIALISDARPGGGPVPHNPGA